MITQWRAGLLILTLMWPLRSEAQDQTSVDNLKAQLKSKQFALELKQQRIRLVKGLMAIVADEKAERGIRFRAVVILGEIRASEAAGTLVAHIDRILPDRILEKTIETLFPCVPALIKIGKPGAREALKELRKPMKKIRRLALVTVLHRVEGRKTAIFLLRDAISSTNNVREIKNLQAALEQRSRFDPD